MSKKKSPAPRAGGSRATQEIQQEFDLFSHPNSQDDARQSNRAEPSSENWLIGAKPAPAYSDEAVAELFANQVQNEFLYMISHRGWMIWDGRAWKSDNVSPRAAVRRILREQASHCPDTKLQRALTSEAKSRAILALAAADPRLACTPEHWDQGDSLLLNTPQGVIDLETGAILAPDPQRRLTRMTSVGPGGDAPLWQEFIRTVTGHDTALEQYLQRVAGYILTGSTTEHVCFMIVGHGANGKSVLAETLAAILGGYHQTASLNLFTASNMERHPTEIAALHSARLVTATETPAHQFWDEQKLKLLTGGDRVSTRRMHENYWELKPQFKIMIFGNHLPRLSDIGEAMRRRLHIIPFRVTIPTCKRDPHLVSKLQSEWSGILSWMIEGTRAFREFGLLPPAAVREASAEYFAGEDMIGSWIKDECFEHAGAEESSKALHESYSRWAEINGEEKLNMSIFGARLRQRGFQPRSNRREQRGWKGLKLKGK